MGGGGASEVPLEVVGAQLIQSLSEDHRSWGLLLTFHSESNGTLFGEEMCYRGDSRSLFSGHVGHFSTYIRP